jgi:hypothetical protein
LAAKSDVGFPYFVYRERSIACADVFSHTFLQPTMSCKIMGLVKYAEERSKRSSELSSNIPDYGMEYGEK